MTPEIKAAIEKKSKEHELFALEDDGPPYPKRRSYNGFLAGAEYGYKMAEEKLEIAVSALKYIANSAPSPEQTFEIENKLAAQKALKELGE